MKSTQFETLFNKMLYIYIIDDKTVFMMVEWFFRTNLQNGICFDERICMNSMIRFSLDLVAVYFTIFLSGVCMNNNIDLL